MPKNTFVMLAHKYDPKKHQIGGWYASEKLDGQRAYWVPETRGLRKGDVSFAGLLTLVGSLNPEHISTGLWSRLGNVIHAPDDFISKLPTSYSLDGELYADGEYRQDLRSIISRYVPDSRWDSVGYNVFDAPSLGKCFHDTYNHLLMVKTQGMVFKENIRLHHQVRLPSATEAAVEAMDAMLETVVAAGGEGVMLRNPWSMWVPHRLYDLLKVKPFDDDEGTVIGYTSGRATDKGSKLLGMMGALILDISHMPFDIKHGEYVLIKKPTKTRQLELSGFTEAERLLKGQEAIDWATANPGQVCPDWVEAAHFSRGDRVTFKYRGLTKDGIPSEARYWRREWK